MGGTQRNGEIILHIILYCIRLYNITSYHITLCYIILPTMCYEFVQTSPISMGEISPIGSSVGAPFFEGQNDSERAFWATPHCSRQLLKFCTHLIRWNNKMDSWTKCLQRPEIFHGAFQISTSSLSYSPFKSVMPMWAERLNMSYVFSCLVWWLELQSTSLQGNWPN